MSTTPSLFDLKELCHQAGVTPRTVRYYIQYGLLPAPGQPGPGARYGRNHLARLRLIRRLQDRHLPLSEIRAQLDGMDEATLEQLSERPASPSSQSALGYIEDLLQSPHVQPARSGRFVESNARVSPESEPRLEERATWERVALGRNVELHIRRPLSKSENRLVENLLAHARNLFRKEELS